MQSCPNIAHCGDQILPGPTSPGRLVIYHVPFTHRPCELATDYNFKVVAIDSVPFS